MVRGIVAQAGAAFPSVRREWRDEKEVASVQQRLKSSHHGLPSCPAGPELA